MDCNDKDHIRGRDATGFMSYLLSLIYTISEFDAVFVVGDVNSRIASKLDFGK